MNMYLCGGLCSCLPWEFGVIGSPGAGVGGTFRLSDVQCWELNSGLQVQLVLFTSSPATVISCRAKSILNSEQTVEMNVFKTDSTVV